MTYLVLAATFQVMKHVSPLIVGGVFILYLLSTPFWAMNFETEKTKTTGDKFAIYFREARANPAAFSKWWDYYVSEVVRTNKIIFKLDLSAKVDTQGVHPYLPIPNAMTDFYKGMIKINNRGYRGENFSKNKNNVYRILTVGDSTTFGQTIFPDSRPWSAVLQQLINTHLRCHQSIEVINGGVNGYHLKNNIDRIEHDYQWLRPDMVLSYVGWNSMADLGIYPQVVTPPEANLSIHPNKAQRVLWYAKKTIASIVNEEGSNFKRAFLIGEEGKSNKELLNTAKKGLLYNNYQEMIEQSRRLKYKLILLSFNTAVTPKSPEFAKKFYEGPWPGVRSIIKQVEIHNQMIRELSLKEHDIDFIDTSNELYGEYDTDKYIDVVHFSTIGDKIMAENIFKEIRPMLIENKVLECQPAIG